MTGQPTRAMRRIPHYVLMVVLAVTLAACATPQARNPMSIVEMMAEQPRATGLACSSQTEALVCETAGLSRMDRKCSCVDRRALGDPSLF